MKNVVSSQQTITLPIHPSLAHANQLIERVSNLRDPNKFFKHLWAVVDYIEREPHFANLCWKWEQDTHGVKSRIHSTELQVYTKSKIAYDTLKSRIQESQINEPIINAKIKELDEHFASQEQCCPPFPWRLAYDGVKELGVLLEGVKRFDLLEGFVTLQNRKISSVAPDGTYEIHQELFIEFFTFASEIVELIDFYEKQTWNITTKHSAWEQLLIARWCYKTPFSYWTRKKLRYDSRYYRKESWERLNLHALWCEMNAIKKKHPGNAKAFFFKLSTYKSYLKKLLQALEQYTKKYVPVETYHLFLDGDCLWVMYKRSDDKRFYPFMIKQLQEDLVIHTFAMQLMHEGQVYLDIPDSHSASGLLERLNIPVKSHLAKLFFNGWSTSQIYFKGKTISGSEMEHQLYVPDLLHELRGLKKQYQSKDHAKLPPNKFLTSLSQ